VSRGAKEVKKLGVALCSDAKKQLREGPVASLFSLPLSFFLPSCLGLVDDFCSLCSSPTSDARDAWETPSWRRYIASLGSMKASVSESFPVSLRKRWVEEDDDEDGFFLEGG